jgi:hypothetical protein
VNATIQIPDQIRFRKQREIAQPLVRIQMLLALLQLAAVLLDWRDDVLDVAFQVVRKGGMFWDWVSAESAWPLAMSLKPVFVPSP